jgi:hypothetical protein
MNATSSPIRPDRFYELRFADLFNTGRGYAFPCDAQGKVNVALLSDRARANYLRACTSVGRDLFAPVTCVLNRGTAGLLAVGQ